MPKPFHELTRHDTDSPRYRRAMRFASTVETIVREFIPSDRLVRRHIHDQLLQMGWEGNLELVHVPDAVDELDKLALERAMIEQHPLFVAHPDILKGGG